MQIQKQQEISCYYKYKGKYGNFIWAKVNCRTRYCYSSHLRDGTFITIHLGFLLRFMTNKHRCKTATCLSWDFGTLHSCSNDIFQNKQKHVFYIKINSWLFLKNTFQDDTFFSKQVHPLISRMRSLYSVNSSELRGPACETWPPQHWMSASVPNVWSTWAEDCVQKETWSSWPLSELSGHHSFPVEKVHVSQVEKCVVELQYKLNVVIFFRIISHRILMAMVGCSNWNGMSDWLELIIEFAKPNPNK